MSRLKAFILFAQAEELGRFPGVTALLKDWGSAGCIVVVVWLFLRAGGNLLTKFREDQKAMQDQHIAALTRITDQFSHAMATQTQAIKSSIDRPRDNE
jgi:hypothetical protein